MKLRFSLRHFSGVFRPAPGLFPRLFVCLCFLDAVDACLVPMVGFDDALRPRCSWSPRLNLHCEPCRKLRPLRRVSGLVDACAPACAW